ncbi:hypothetical protein P9112_012767 [Eukaryota sp. TZLM1-RC]
MQGELATDLTVQSSLRNALRIIGRSSLLSFIFSCLLLTDWLSNQTKISRLLLPGAISFCITNIIAYILLKRSYIKILLLVIIKSLLTIGYYSYETWLNWAPSKQVKIAAFMVTAIVDCLYALVILLTWMDIKHHQPRLRGHTTRTETKQRKSSSRSACEDPMLIKVKRF